MAFDCASCSISNASRKALVEHMIEKHDSPFLDGDERLIALSLAHVKAKKDERLLQKFRDNGNEVD